MSLYGWYRWYEQSVQCLEEDLEDGHISLEEFRKRMRELVEEYQQARYDIGQDVNDNNY